MTGRRALLLGGALLLAAGGLVALRPGPAPTSLDGGSPDAGPPEVDVHYADFVGASACAPCHREQYERWAASTHGRAGGEPSDVALIAQFDGRPRAFRDATVTPAKTDGKLTFSVHEPGASDSVLEVAAVVGGGHMHGGGTQAFFTRFPDGTLRFLPFDFIRAEGLWFCSAHVAGSEGLVPISPRLSIRDCADWPPRRVLGESPEHENCQSCHGSQLRLVRDVEARAFRTDRRTLAIDCEACHGPGRQHVERVSDPVAVAGGDLAMRSLATLDKDASLDVCFSCHALKTPLEPGYLSGMRFASHYSRLFPLLDDDAVHADGRTKSFAYQQGHLWSDCYVRGGMTCTSCHDPHSQGYRDHVGRPLEGRFDDGQCTSCHASKRAAPEAHTHHAPGSPGSRCVSCHMPYLQQPAFGSELRYARSDHTIPVPRPALDAALGVESACHACHADLTVDAQVAQIAKWYGPPKPLAQAVEAALQIERVDDIREAARLVLRPEERHAAALFAGMSRFGAKFLAPDPQEVSEETLERLSALAEHPDVDVRGLALAFLDMARTRTPRADAALARLRGAAGREPADLRARWVAALLFFADTARQRGALLRAADLLEKARAVEPRRADVLTELASVHAQGGRLAEAATLLRRSLEIEPVQPRAPFRGGPRPSRARSRRGAPRRGRDTLTTLPGDRAGPAARAPLPRRGAPRRERAREGRGGLGAGGRDRRRRRARSPPPGGAGPRRLAHR